MDNLLREHRKRRDTIKLKKKIPRLGFLRELAHRETEREREQWERDEERQTARH